MNLESISDDLIIYFLCLIFAATFKPLSSSTSSSSPSSSSPPHLFELLTFLIPCRLILHVTPRYSPSLPFTLYCLVFFHFYFSSLIRIACLPTFSHVHQNTTFTTTHLFAAQFADRNAPSIYHPFSVISYQDHHHPPPSFSLVSFRLSFFLTNLLLLTSLITYPPRSNLLSTLGYFQTNKQTIDQPKYSARTN